MNINKRREIINNVISNNKNKQSFMASVMDIYEKMVNDENSNITTVLAPDGYEITLEDQWNNNEDFIG